MRIAAIAVSLGVVALVACSSDSNGPTSGSLSAQDAAALSTALVSSGSLGADAAGFAPAALTQLRSVGTIGAYDAVAVQVQYTYTIGATSQSGVISSVIGWQGLNTSAQTVDKILAASNYTASGTFPATETATFGSSGAIGSYYDRTTQTSYLANGGTFTVTGATFGGSSTNCNQSSGGFTATCSYSTGTMTGSFDFTADKVGATGTGAAAFTQPSTTFDLPAVRLTISVTQ